MKLCLTWIWISELTPRSFRCKYFTWSFWPIFSALHPLELFCVFLSVSCLTFWFAHTSRLQWLREVFFVGKSPRLGRAGQAGVYVSHEYWRAGTTTFEPHLQLGVSKENILIQLNRWTLIHSSGSGMAEERKGKGRRRGWEGSKSFAVHFPAKFTTRNGTPFREQKNPPGDNSWNVNRWEISRSV